MYKFLVLSCVVAVCLAEIKVVSDNHLEGCVHCEGSPSSLKTVLKDLEQYKPITFLNGLSLQLEKTQIPAPALDTTSENYVQSRQSRMLPFLSSHALKLDLGVMKFRLGRSDEDDEKLELSVFVPDEKNGVAREKKTAKIILPMIIGFKAATTLVVAIMAVSLLTFKALLAAKIALLVTGIIAIKKLLDGKHGGGGAGLSAAQHASPYMMGNYNLDIPDAAAYQGTTGYDAYANYGLSGQEAAASDLSSQYSSGQGMLELVGSNNTAAAVAAAAKRRDNLRRRPFIAKQHPVFNYRKTLRP